MFTGIIRHRGEVRAARTRDAGARRLVVAPSPPLEAVALGDSVALDGVCLTVAAIGEEGLAFDVVPETLRKTTLGALEPGARVHLEPALRLGQELGGHWVQGHVEGTGEVTALEREGEDVRLVLRVDETLFGGMLPKGSVTLDGVSLTIGETWAEPGDDGGGRFSVYLVPHTLSLTTLGEHGPGDRLNVEPDVLGRWVAHHVERVLGASDGEGESERASGPPTGGGS